MLAKTLIIPTCLDDMLADTRAILDRLRREFPDREEFDQRVYLPLAETLKYQGFDRATIHWTMRVIFEGSGHKEGVNYAEINRLCE